MAIRPHKLERKYRLTLRQLLEDDFIECVRSPSKFSVLLETLGLVDIFVETEKGKTYYKELLEARDE